MQLLKEIILPINGMGSILSSLLILLFLVSSIQEKEFRAARLGLVGFLGNSTLWWLLFHYRQVETITVINVSLLAVGGVMAMVSLIKYFPQGRERDLSGITKYDERDYMFSRNQLKSHPELAEKYYGLHPEKKEIDGKIHEKPELGEEGGLLYAPYESEIFEAIFRHLDRARPLSRGDIWTTNTETTIDSKKMTETLDGLARFLGAVDVGFTRVNDYHLYSHAGRHVDNWGEAIVNEHSHAIVIVVAMKVEMIKQAPLLPTILESSRQYLEAAKIANIVAEYIRGFGRDARAHTDGNYETLCVPTAVDSGMGVLGRMGILMHPVYGPCIRLAVVTTDMKLATQKKKINGRSMEAFCDICKKCSDNCPTQSICKDNEPESRGFRHWSINQEKCFSYWKTMGTDCGFCIRVCPYTKPDTFIHKLVRFYISRNPLNQRLALLMDDIFYGRKIPVRVKNNKRQGK